MTTPESPAVEAEAPMTEEPSSPGTSARYSGGRPYRKYLLWYGLATAGIVALWGAAAGVILPNHIQGIAFREWFTGLDAAVDLVALNNLKAQVDAGAVQPTAEQTRLLGILAGFDAARAQSLALVSAIGVFVTMFIQPITGVLSDRTRSGWGRRAPWILGGAVIGSGLLVGLRYANSILLVAVFWALAQLVVNIAQGPLNTTVADRVREDKLGGASAITGLGSMVGGVFGGVLAGVLFGSIGLDVYYVFAGVMLALCLAFVFMAPDRSSRGLEVAPMRWGGFFASFLIPLRDADYRWVWLAKIVMMFGYAVSTAFGFFMMQSYIRPALSAAEATQLAPLLGLVALPGMVVSMLVCGRWSDRIQRRKPFVFWTSVLMAASFLLPLFWPSLPALFIQAVISGIALGGYMVVDQALFIDVIQDKRTAGRDLGMSALGGNLGQALGPLLAGQLVAFTGGYSGVWIMGAVIVTIAAVAILPVKRAR
ncbi:MFS transporter [Tessaracoccus sp. G1721]